MEKAEKIQLQCLECGKHFSRNLGSNSEKEVTCPKCKSTDVDLA